MRNKLGEKKAWASSLEARTVQARFVALTSNLLLLHEHRLEIDHEVTDRRREQRMGWAERACPRGRTSNIEGAATRQGGDPAQREVYSLASRCTPAPSHGTRRCDSPEATLCNPVTSSVTHRCQRRVQSVKKHFDRSFNAFYQRVVLREVGAGAYT